MHKWQLELKNSVTDYLELFKLLHLDPKLININKDNKFPLLVTKSFINRMNKGDFNDPLLQQILPSSHENVIKNNYSADPLQEKTFNKIPGLLHKYAGRVLILSAKSCFVNCRYCIRKEFSYTSNIASGENLEKIINYIAADSSIHEVILSGGDPLIASNNYFTKLIYKLEKISHVLTLRIHSRVPIVLPSRLETELINIFFNSRFNIVLAIHSNHPNEINDEVVECFKNLHNTKIILLNQSVLLKNINDDANTLAELSKKLFAIKVLPYYLHMLDPVIGTQHFAVELSKAKQIFSELSSKVPGYLLPRLVVEQPGAANKILI